MIINLKKKNILRASKVESQGSYLKVNKSERDSISTLMINNFKSNVILEHNNNLIHQLLILNKKVGEKI
jgi:hypothetical protein